MTTAEALSLIDYAKKEKVKLTEWEEIFVRDILRLGRINMMKKISDKQADTVQRIYSKAVGNFNKVYPQKF